MNPGTTSEESASPATQEVFTPPIEEASGGAIEQTSIKLNLPPKPVLATTILPETVPVAEASSLSPFQEPPTLPVETPSPELSSTSETETLFKATQENKSSKKKFAVGLPLALLFFLIALLSLFIQLRFLF